MLVRFNKITNLLVVIFFLGVSLWTMTTCEAIFHFQLIFSFLSSDVQFPLRVNSVREDIVISRKSKEQGGVTNEAGEGSTFRYSVVLHYDVINRRLCFGYKRFSPMFLVYMGGVSYRTNGNNMQAPPNMQQGGQGHGPNGGGPGGGGSFGTGQHGPLRLFQKELSGQISWLLPLGAFASIGLLACLRRRQPLTDKQQETLFWLSWLLPVATFFSIAGFFHHYYLIMLAPPIAAITGAGWVQLVELFHNREGWKTWLLPLAVLVTTAFERYILQSYIQKIGKGWSIGIGVAGVGVTISLIVAAKIGGC